MVTAYKKRKKARPASKLDTSTLRGFGGGWNAIDDDLSMKPHFQVSLVNFHRTTSGAQAVRFGQKWNADIKNVRNSPIIDGFYFAGANIVVTKSGNVLAIAGDGSAIVEIWNEAAAGGAPGGAWKKEIEQVSFVPFKDQLIIHNGIEKPIIVSKIPTGFNVKYLQDEATGSGANTPIGKYGCVAANYHCVAHITYTSLGPGGDLVVDKIKPTEVYVSAKGTAGTFEGDPAPNDAMSFDVGAYAPEGAASIRGIAGFRTYLLIFLQNTTVQVKLGEYDDSDPPIHVPRFPDTLPQFGVLGNRTIVTVENDIMFCGLSGLASAKRNLYAPDSITSDFLSTQISPAYRRIVGALEDHDQLVKSFAAYDRLNNDFLLFMPDGKVLCYTFNPRLKMNAWSLYHDMDWDAAWTSVLGRLYVAKGTRVFLSGNNTFAGERFYSDRMLDRDYTYNSAQTGNFVAGEIVYDPELQESWTCTVTHPMEGQLTFEVERINHIDKWVQYKGREILIEFELPWIDGKDPVKLKQLRYISLATKGDAEFTVQAYVDNLFKDVEGELLTDYWGNTIKPGIEMVFIGNDAYGYGFADDTIDTGYGMGRRSRDPRLYGFPIKFKSIKFRIHGRITKKLEIVNLSFIYARNKLHGYIR